MVQFLASVIYFFWIVDSASHKWVPEFLEFSGKNKATGKVTGHATTMSKPRICECETCYMSMVVSAMQLPWLFYIDIDNQVCCQFSHPLFKLYSYVHPLVIMHIVYRPSLSNFCQKESWFFTTFPASHIVMSRQLCHCLGFSPTFSHFNTKL